MDASPDRPSWTSATSPVPIWIGTVVAAAGFVVLALGWLKVEAESELSRQLPYVISTGLGGVGLVLVGGFLVALQSLRRESALRTQLLEKLSAVVADIAERRDEAGAAGVMTVSAVAVVAGFVALLAGGAAAARSDVPAEQMPLVLGCGLGGVALILGGLMLAHVDLAKSLAAREREVLAELADQAIGARAAGAAASPATRARR